MKNESYVEAMVDAVCSDCARNMGWKPKDKVVGVWPGKCDVCGKNRSLTSLHHDWEKGETK